MQMERPSLPENQDQHSSVVMGRRKEEGKREGGERSDKNTTQGWQGSGLSTSLLNIEPGIVS
jgi:hypothetical protein